MIVSFPGKTVETKQITRAQYAHNLSTTIRQGFNEFDQAFAQGKGIQGSISLMINGFIRSIESLPTAGTPVFQAVDLMAIGQKCSNA